MNKFDNDSQLEEMFKNAAQEINQTPNQNQNKNSYKKVIITILGVMIIFSFALYIGAIKLRPQEFKNNTNSPDWVQMQIEKEKTKEETSTWQFEYPVKLPSWSKQPYDINKFSKDGDLYSELIDFAQQFPDIIGQTAWMPSSTQGQWENAPPAFTNDINEKYLPDGTINPYYSYVLKEDYLTAYSIYLQRLLNPVFGQWVFAQRYEPVKPLKDNNTFEVLKDMFSNEWWDNNIKTNSDYSKLPILVDWDGTNFGGLKFAERKPGRYGTFFGTVNVDEEAKRFVIAESKGKDNMGAEILKINTPVKYVAFGEEDKLIEIYGNLVITLSSNNGTSSFNRIVITDAELILE